MGFSSTLYAGEPIINDDTVLDLALLTAEGRGLELPRSHSLDGGNYGDLAAAFPSELEIPENEWQARIQEKEERKNRLSDIITTAQLPHKDQNGTNYCWINAPTHCVEIQRLEQNQPMVILSPASVGCKIKNFRNSGGWGKEGLLYIVDHGIVPASLWPANAIARQYDKPESWAEADKYKVTEWVELRPRNLKQLISCLLRNIPVAVGYNWWSHEVTLCDAAWIDGAAAGRIRNSWKDWGVNGFGILQGSKLLADDAVCPLTVMGG